MEKENTVFTIRRLFKEDMVLINRYCESFSHMYFNPLTEDYVWHILLQGAFWAVYQGAVPVAVTYVLPADSPAFASLDAAWHLQDLLDCSGENTLLCGYVWTDENCADVDFYSPLVRLWSVQGTRRGRSMLVHCMPADKNGDIGPLLYNGFGLRGLRGLDNLVPHYIFTKQAELNCRKTEIYHEIKTCPFSDTKTISQLCEKGYTGFDMDVEKNILFRR